jgi:eukaryotic-like serine/threonine-protein kinase
MIGRTLGHYRIESQLGAGGMGVVYRAHDTTLDRTVAIKVVGERLSSDPKARDRLLREARTASALNHPHVCTIHEVGEAEGQVFIAMEYVEGGSLSALLSEPRPTEMVVRYGIQIADALAHAHDRGIVHRDLKTSNVMLTPEGRTKVLDFGLAKRLPTEDIAQRPTRTDGSLTEAGQVVGTLHYIAPEVLRGQPADTRADIWALGVLLYELATGDLPFNGKTRFEVTHAILGEAPTALPEKVPAGMRAVIQRCLAKAPSQRYQRASEVRAALEAIESGSAGVPWMRPESRRRLLWGASALTAAALLTAAGLSYFGGRGRSIDSIAVMPLANVGGDPDTEYLSDGIAEGVISSLSKLPRLKVIAFSSVVRYRGRTVDPKEVVRDLKVGAVLTGRVVQRGDTVSIHTELVDTQDGRRLWGEQYDARMGGILTVQDDIAEKISGQLGSRLTGDDKQRLASRDNENTEAYQLYLKGHYYLDKGTREDYEKSLEFFRRVIETYPNYAPAYFGIADAYGGMTWEGMLLPAEGFAQSEAALETGLKLDDTAGKGHSDLAWLRWGKDWDFPAADKEWRRAVSLDPHDPYIRRSFAKFLRSQGRWEEAFEEMKQAQKLDPLGLETNNSLGHTYYWARRYDEAIDQAKKTLEIDPTYVPAHLLLTEVYARKGMYQEAIAEQQQTFVLNDDREGAQGLGEDFKALGFEPVVRQLYRSSIDAFREAAKTRYVSPIGFAVNYAKLGDKDQAFAWLEKAYADRSPWMMLLKQDPDFDNLRSDPRFGVLLKRVGLVP